MAFKRSAVRFCLSPLKTKLGEKKLFTMTSLRERSQVILWLLLFFFIASMTVGGLVGGANILDVILGRKNLNLYVGTIDGKSITRQEFEYERQIQLNRITQQGGEINDQTIINAGNQAWNSIVESYIKDMKIEELGLTVYSEEVYDFLLQSPPPVFQTNLTDAGFFLDQEGAFDLSAYQSAVIAGNIPTEIENLLLLWENYLKSWLADRKLRNMYNSLASVTEKEVMDDYYKKNIEVEINYLYINPNDLPDSLVAVFEEEIENEYNKSKEDKYKIEETVTIDYTFFPFPDIDKDSLAYSIEKDSLMSQAYLLSDESKYTSFNEANNLYSKTTEDTLEVNQLLTGNSGIPFALGNSRKVIRFAFDGSVGSVSEPIEMKNGVCVFRILSKNDKSYKPLADVREGINRILLRDLKKEKAQSLILEAVSNHLNWSSVADNNEYIQYLSEQKGNISSSFTSIGKSSALEGAMMSLNEGETSKLIETGTSYLFLEIASKAEINDEDFIENSESIRSQLLSTKRSRGYFQWLTSRREEIEIDDWRHLIY